MSISTRLALYRELSKSGIVALVLISVLGGYLAGHRFELPLDWRMLSLTLFGVLFLASGSSALNQYQDRSLDAEMPRTAQRPIPSGRISPSRALAFSLGAIALGALLLAQVDTKVLLLGAAAVVSYNFLYTPWWKRRWAYAAVPGAVPGALPILMGFVASSGSLSAPGGWYLFALLFSWQMPHFWVLALRYKGDYEKGRIPTLPVAYGAGMTVRQIVLWCGVYVAQGLAAPLFLGVGKVYWAVAVPTSLWLLWALAGFARAPENRGWLRFFLSVNFSLILYIGGAVADLWSVYLVPYLTR